MTVEATILPSSGRRQVAVALMIATAMQAFDSTIANVALPQLEQSLGGGLDLGSWVMTSYLCASAVMATLTGWFRRRFGARQAFTGAIALFVIASLLCSIATRIDPVPPGPRRCRRHHPAVGAGNPSRHLPQTTARPHAGDMGSDDQ